MKFSNLNDNKVTEQTGISNGLIGKARKSNGDLSLKNISKILYAYPDLNPTWLLTGEGEMLKSNNTIEEPPIRDPRDVEMIELLKFKIKSLEEEIIILKENNLKI